MWVSLALALLLTGGCAKTGQTQAGQPSVSPPPQTVSPGGQGQKMISEEDAQSIAINFLRSSPTFRFDGMASSLKLAGSEAGAKLNSWVFHYEFQSRQAGYGDRTGLVAAQVITDHKAEIRVEQGEVTYAVLDGRWDELKGKRVE